MKKLINLMMILQISVFAGIFQENSLLKIETREGFNIYINNKFRGVSGKGTTSIKLAEGLYKIKVSANSIDGDWYYEAKKNIYIGKDMEIQTTLFPKKYPTKQYKEHEKQKNILIKQYYYDHKSEFKKPINKYKVWYITTSTKNKAIDIINIINKASNKRDKFIELTKRKEIKGELLDWFSPNEMVQEFSNATLKLKKGEYTDKPVKSAFGYHIIFLEGILEGQLTLEESRKSIEKILKL